MWDLFFLVGLLGAVALMGYIAYMMLRSYFIPKGSTLFKGFVFGPVLKKLDKSKFRIIKKVSSDYADKLNFIDFALISNYGVFFIKKKDTKGVVESARGRDGYAVNYKGHVRFYKDEAAELAKDIEKMKAATAVLKEVKTHIMVVYPNETKIKVQTEAFCGNFKDMTDFINSRCTTENEISDELKEQIYKAMTDEKEKVTI